MNAKTTTKKPATKKAKPQSAPGLPAAATVEPDGGTLKMPAEDGKSHARLVADMVTRGEALNAITAMRYVKPELGQVDLSEMAASLRAGGDAVSGGDLGSAEKLLHAQAVSLNAIFSELARRSHLNMGEFMDASERYMRLALKAQSQCRATLETLAAIKNPPIVYARQMNVANGPQQVNNGAAANNEKQQQPAAHAAENRTQPSQLLEDASHGGTQMDA